jgi:uncharacterized protein
MGIMDCLKCGTCCTAPDITALGKELGARCMHLDDHELCAIYEERPPVCKGYQADWLCLEIAAPTLAERVERYLALFGLQ